MVIVAENLRGAEESLSRKRVATVLSTLARRGNFHTPLPGGKQSGGTDMVQAKSPQSRGVTLLIATKKGLWQMQSDATRRSWRLSGPQFLGHVVHHAVADPRDRKTMLAAARTGHL